MNNIDARGMSCPQPVLMVKKAIDNGSVDLEILVDDNTAKNNVEKYLVNNGFKSIAISESDDTMILKARK